MRLQLTQDAKGKVLLWVEDVPAFELRPDETLIECLKRGILYFWKEKDEPYGNADPWAGKYARTLEKFLESLKIWGIFEKLMSTG